MKSDALFHINLAIKCLDKNDVNGAIKHLSRAIEILSEAIENFKNDN